MRGPQTEITFQYYIQIIDGRAPAGFGEWQVGSATRRSCRMPPLNVRKIPSKIDANGPLSNRNLTFLPPYSIWAPHRSRSAVLVISRPEKISMPLRTMHFLSH